MSGSNPPSTSGSPCIARRAVSTSAAVAVLAVALPVVLVAAIAAFASSATARSAPQPVADVVVARSASRPTPADIEVTAPATPPTTAAAPPTTVAPEPPAPAPAPAAPAPAPQPGAAGDPNDPASWERLAQCESGGNWAINTGNGYYGGLQFSLSSWRNVGGTGYPHEAPKETQIEMGKRLHAQGGWGHWPACTRSFGWR